MKKFILLISVLLAVGSASAQEALNDIKADIHVAASNLLAYPGPHKQLTPAPKGYKPFYISHYGRHGSRYLIDPNDYDFPLSTLKRADELGKLTPLGKETLKKVIMLHDEAEKRLGELTLLGAEQHQDIARRMYERFPEVFAGKTNIDAKSTIVIRCILSMENALHALLKENPQLQIRHDASEHDMFYMNHDDSEVTAFQWTDEACKAFNDFTKDKDTSERIAKLLFNDYGYAQALDMKRLNSRLFNLANAVQNTELRHKIDLYNLFDAESAYTNWRIDNAKWYIRYSASPLNGSTQPFTQRNLLSNIVETADSCIRLQHPGATLRFGHETMVLPLVSLINVNGAGEQIADLNQLDERGWINYHYFPMGANLQIVFYRNNKKAGDILVKFLLNEDEASIPVKTDCAPYYHWNDVRPYLMERINGFKPYKK